MCYTIAYKHTVLGRSINKKSVDDTVHYSRSVTFPRIAWMHIIPIMIIFKLVVGHFYKLEIIKKRAFSVLYSV